MTTASGLAADGNSFNNCISFHNCHIGNASTTDTLSLPLMFELFNVRLLQFTECALERCDIMFKDFIDTDANGQPLNTQSRVEQVNIERCWLERFKVLYQYDKNDDVAPKITDSKVVDLGEAY
jgi:hypothetical protein